MGKTIPENPGLGGRLNPGFGFEKSPGFRVRANPGCKPYLVAMNALIIFTGLFSGFF